MTSLYAVFRLLHLYDCNLFIYLFLLTTFNTISKQVANLPKPLYYSWITAYGAPMTCNFYLMLSTLRTREEDLVESNPVT